MKFTCYIKKCGVKSEIFNLSRISLILTSVVCFMLSFSLQECHYLTHEVFFRLFWVLLFFFPEEDSKETYELSN